MNKNVIITVLIGFIIFFTGCVEEKETSTEIPAITALPSPTSTVAETPITEVSFTPEPSETWPKYIITYDSLHDGEIEYSNGQRVKITEIIMIGIVSPKNFDVATSDFKVTSYENANLHSSRETYKVSREISKETYESYKKMQVEESYVDVSLHIIHETIPIVNDESMQKIIDFLIEDTTNEMVDSQHESKNHIYFTKQLSKNASEQNLSFGVIVLGRMEAIHPSDYYALNYFYVDNQLYLIDPITDEIITVCETFDYGYGYGKLYPDESTLPIYRGQRRIKHDINLSEICEEQRGFI